MTVSQADQPDDNAEDKPTGIAKAGQNFIEQIVRLGVDGFGPFKSAKESAQEALRGRSREEAVKILVRNHCLVAGAQGFVTNIGGLITMPVALPANIGASYLVQSHLAAAIAHVHGHNTRSEDVQTAILLCLLGNAGTEVVKQVGIQVGTKYGMTVLKNIPMAVIHQINRKAGFALLAKYGTKRAAITLAKGIPLIGGGIGGTIDAVSTKAVGTFANNFFKP